MFPAFRHAEGGPQRRRNEAYPSQTRADGQTTPQDPAAGASTDRM